MTSTQRAARLKQSDALLRNVSRTASKERYSQSDAPSSMVSLGCAMTHCIFNSLAHSPTDVRQPLAATPVWFRWASLIVDSDHPVSEFLGVYLASTPLVKRYS
jgi:hypothetical protein